MLYKRHDKEFEGILATLSRVPPHTYFGQVVSVTGLLVEVSGIAHHACLGSVVRIHSKKKLLGEVIGFRQTFALVMAYGNLEGLRPGQRVDVCEEGFALYPTPAWQGRILDGMGNPLDGLGHLPQGIQAYAVKASPPPAPERLKVHERVDLGVRALNTFLTCCLGQRMGIFAGSGIGKSILLGQITRFTSCDVVIVGLIGERGREVKEFIDEHLGEEGLKRSIVVVATSDQPALIRRQAAYITLTLAEFFRDLGLNVLCVIDSITRVASAQREIGLSGKEPPTTRGYPPTVFSELPRLLERAGPGIDKGSITGLFTVLVEGDDPNEPIADAARSILDGHIFLDRSIAERGRYPAVNILKSVSRMMPQCNPLEEAHLIQQARKILATYEDMSEMIRLGAYPPGSSPEVDQAIHLYPLLENFLRQDRQEKSSFPEGFQKLKDILS